jgi:hypothetical protein
VLLCSPDCLLRGEGEGNREVIISLGGIRTLGGDGDLEREGTTAFLSGEGDLERKGTTVFRSGDGDGDRDLEGTTLEQGFRCIRGDDNLREVVASFLDFGDSGEGDLEREGTTAFRSGDGDFNREGAIMSDKMRGGCCFDDDLDLEEVGII